MTKLLTLKNFVFLLTLVFFISAVRGFVISGPFNNTTIFLFVITAAFFCYGYFFEKLSKLKWLNVLICLGFAIVLFSSLALGIYGNRNTANFNEDVVIVLGAGIVDDMPRPGLASRLDAAVSYHRQNPDALIIVSGGLGHRENYTEAYVMARYLIAHGVPAERILLEDKAYSTYSNMRYAAEIISAIFEVPPSIVVITNDFHMYRSVRFVRQVGLDATMYPASTPMLSAPFSYLREIPSVIKMWIFNE